MGLTTFINSFRRNEEHIVEEHVVEEEIPHIEFGFMPVVRDTREEPIHWYNDNAHYSLAMAQEQMADCFITDADEFLDWDLYRNKSGIWFDKDFRGGYLD